MHCGAWGHCCGLEEGDRVPWSPRPTVQASGDPDPGFALPFLLQALALLGPHCFYHTTLPFSVKFLRPRG